MRNIKTYQQHINESNEQYDDVWFVWGYSDPEEIPYDYPERFRIIEIWDDRQKAVDGYNEFTYSYDSDDRWSFKNPVTGEVQQFSTVGMDGLKTIKENLEDLGLEDTVDFDSYIRSCDTREILGFAELPPWAKVAIKRTLKTRRLFGV